MTLEQEITNLVESTINQLGYELVLVKIRGTDIKTIEILIDRAQEGGVTVGDCRVVSKNISPILDVEDIIKDKYFLEVSSAGLERPLTKLDDYKKFIGRTAKLKLKEALEGSRNYQGEILKVEENDISLQQANKQIILINYFSIKSARLVITDKLFKEIMDKAKKNQFN